MSQNKLLSQEYAAFIQNINKSNPPAELSKQVFTQVQSMMKVSPALIGFKIAFLHSLVTLVLIYFCPQFGVSWGKPSAILMSFFMRFGHEACAALCGSYLVGGSFLMISLFLRAEESFWLKKQMLWLPAFLAIFTLGILLLNGANAHHTELILWSVSAIFASWLFFGLGRATRIKSFRLWSNLKSLP